MLAILLVFIEQGFSPKSSTSPELEPIEVVSQLLPKCLDGCLGVFELDARHAGHLLATVAVPSLETLWSEQESRDEVYRIANAATGTDWLEFRVHVQF